MEESEITEVEWLKMGIKSRLIEDNQGNIHVISKNPKGICISMGFVDKILFYQYPNLFWKAIGKIAFTPKNKKIIFNKE